MSKLEKTGLSKIIRETVKVYEEKGIPLKDIGNGECENFQYDVLNAWAGDGWVHRDGSDFNAIGTLGLCDEEDRFNLDLINEHWGGFPENLDDKVIQILGASWATHEWIHFEGRHYDAEAPEGVVHFTDLPFFQRWIEHIKGDLEENPTCFDDLIDPPAPDDLISVSDDVIPVPW
jgi:hypothetical protein